MLLEEKMTSTTRTKEKNTTSSIAQDVGIMVEVAMRASASVYELRSKVDTFLAICQRGADYNDTVDWDEWRDRLIEHGATARREIGIGSPTTLRTVSLRAP
jgi:hypothetical protein